MTSQPSSDPGLIETLRQALDSTYEIEREIGGGMSRVFVATERALGRRVVIKVLPPELTAGVNRERFRREIQFAARLQHPHIVPLLTAGQVGDILYYTMPLVEGETLRSRLEREQRLPAAAVVAILQDVVDALAYAHSRGLIHRDIKPENILLQRNHALVTDFGVAKAISEALPGTAATTIGIAVGTPAYMAPEQLAADPAADHRIDLYAVGLLGYELLNGASPFSGSSPQQTLARQMTERPTPPHIRRADVPPDLSSLIMRCLEKDPASRWRSAEELLEALARLRLTGRVPALSRLAGMPHARRNLIVGSTLILLLAAGLATYSMLGAHRGTKPEGTAAARETLQTTTLAAGLTRADSEAIAAAFARRILEQRQPRRDTTPTAARGGTHAPAPPPGTHPPAPAPSPGPAANTKLDTVVHVPGAPTIVIPQFGPDIDRVKLDSIRMQAEHIISDSVMKTLSLMRNFRWRGPSGRPGAVSIPREFDPGPNPEKGPLRLAVLGVIDVSRAHELKEIAVAVSDSLVRTLGRREGTQVLGGKKLAQLEEALGSDEMLGMDLGVRFVLRSSLAARGDSLILFVAAFDTRQQRYVQPFRATAPRTQPDELARKISPLITAWLDKIKKPT
jgi:serine/threonine-protein kinase